MLQEYMVISWIYIQLETIFLATYQFLCKQGYFYSQMDENARKFVKRSHSYVKETTI